MAEKRCPQMWENVKSMEKLAEKSEFQVPMEGHTREMSYNNSRDI